MPLYGLSPRQAFRPSGAHALVFDGNSLVQGVGAATPLPAALMGRPFFAGSGAAMVNLGVGGQTWRQMDGLDGGSAADVDGACAAGRTDILLAWETTNSVFNAGRTVQQTIGDARAYVANRLAAHPDRVVVLLTSLPREAGPAVAPDRASVEAANAVLSAVDDHFRAAYRAMGARALVDLRGPSSPFAFTGYAPADFDAAGPYWAEGPGGRIHLNDAGYGLVADMIVAACRRMALR
jgi:hypothetical protein